MPITASELIIRKAEVNNETPATNGGKMGTTVVTSGNTNNVFPNTSQAERTAGLTRYRKVFLKNNSAENLALTATKIFMDNITPADDMIYFIPGTQDDVETAISGRNYGCGTVSVTANIGASSIDVDVENDNLGAPLVLFAPGDTIRVTDKVTANAVSGNEEYHVIDTLGALVGNTQTINLVGTLANQYTNVAGRVMSVYEPGSLNAALGSFVPTTASGTFDQGQITTNIRGAIAENWSFVFTSATDFDLYADGSPTGLSGNISGTFAPTNPDTATPYFTVNVAAWGGTWVAAETVAFTQVPAAAPVWLRQDVEAGTAAFSSNTVTIVMDGESA